MKTLIFSYKTYSSNLCFIYSFEKKNSVAYTKPDLAELCDLVCVLFISIRTLGPPLAVLQCLYATALIPVLSPTDCVQDVKSLQRVKDFELSVISEISPKWLHIFRCGSSTTFCTMI